MQRRKLKITIESFLINAISKTSRDQVDLAFGRQRCLSQRLPNPPRKRSLEAIVIDQIHVLLIDRIASTLLMIDDIVDFRASMRGREVAEAVYIQYSSVRRERRGVKDFDEPTNQLKPLSHVI